MTASSGNAGQRAAGRWAGRGWRSGRLAVAGAALALAAWPGGSALAAANPGVNRAPSPDFAQTCASYGAGSASCEAATVAAVNNAHRAEGIRPMRLPTGFWRLSPARQVFVVTDLERVDRGLRPFLGMTFPLDRDAGAAAYANRDPQTGWASGPDQVRSYGSIWAAEFNPVAADYAWMYDDGWGGPGQTTNVACPAPGAPGCWGHRDVILGGYGDAPLLLAGVGSVNRGYADYYESATELFAGATGRTPPLYYAWASAVAAGAH
jgi:hypothetical protein